MNSNNNLIERLNELESLKEALSEDTLMKPAVVALEWAISALSPVLPDEAEMLLAICEQELNKKYYALAKEIISKYQSERSSLLLENEDLQDRLQWYENSALPEDVARWINLLSDFDRAYGKDKRYGEIADLIERQEITICTLTERLDAKLRRIEELDKDKIACGKLIKKQTRQITEYDEACSSFHRSITSEDITDDGEYVLVRIDKLESFESELQSIREMK